MSEVESVRDLVVRAAVVKHIITHAQAEEARVKAALRLVMDQGDRKHAVLPDGTDVATVSYTSPSPVPGGWAIEDEAALVAWLDRHRDGAGTVTTRSVAPWQASPAALDGLVQAEAGTIPDGVVWRPDAVRAATVMVRATPAQQEALRTALAGGVLDVAGFLTAGDTETGNA